MRLGAIFVALCMVLIAGSAGAVVYLVFGFSGGETVTVALAVLTGLGLYNAFTSRGGGSVGASQFADLAHATADLARQVGEIGRRLATLQSKVENTIERTRAATNPLAVETDELGMLVNQLAETVARHETRLAELARPRPMPAAAAAAAAAAAVPAAASESTSSEAMGPVEPAAPTRPEPPSTALAAGVHDALAASVRDALASEDMLAVIRDAIDANRVDLYLQPIVTLPQRKVRYYEAMSRLRTDKGEVLQAANFIAQAERGGLMPQIDNLNVLRCVQVVRRLLLKNREIGLFCNLAGSTLADASVFPQLLEFLEANRAIAPSFAIEITQSVLRGAGPIENESLAALAERGFRFSLDNLQDLRLEPRELATRGFRFVKVPGSLLLNRTGAVAGTDIHPADLSDLLGRFGIDLIAEKIESEGMVVDLLDYDVRFGQGFLFSPPRPVRAEALQGAERSDPVTRETAAAEADAGGISARAPETDDMTATEAKEPRLGGVAQLARRV